MPNDFYEDESRRVNERVDRDAERDPEREQARPRVTLIPKAAITCATCGNDQPTHHAIHCKGMFEVSR